MRVSNVRLLKIVDRLPQARVILYGDLVLDRFILGTPKRISREAPVIILRHERQEDVPGGGANALANLSSLGVSVFPIGAVGEDEPGRALRTALGRLDIDTSRIITVPNFKTPTKVRILGGGPTSLKHQVARYDIEDHLPETGSWAGRLANHMAECSDGTGAIAVSDYGYGSVTNEVLKTCGDLQPPDCWICLDSRYRTGLFDNIGSATPNLEELEAWAGHRLVGHEQVAEAAEALRRALGARFVLATRGNQGMTLVEIDREPLHIPVFGTDEVADVTGAGDTVLATLVATLAAGATPAEAAGLANIAGGLVVMKLGTATVSHQELRRAVLSLEDRR